ncbi:MAG: 4-hydroxy-tetrahydrodipicolinate reductase [Flammeovirgaceae bacterium]|nr:MAG: 4-hydroxy-tetrahydrodipicolinate reductase [Flammeovirgaceae bacterium]
MNILLLGYGKMGKAVEQVAMKRGHRIVDRITSGNRYNPGHVVADVAIEFSSPEVAVENITWCLQHNLPIVCGTTGWLDKKGLIEKLTRDCNGTFFYASNFSIGVNMFFKLNEYLARLMAGYNSYEVQIDETHHTEKKDAPSGTAITLAEGIIKHLPSKTTWVNHTPGKQHELPILSHRIANVPGTHVVKYQCPVDTIKISHEAHSREGFALGAVAVAEWLPGKKGVLTMGDFLQL